MSPDQSGGTVLGMELLVMYRFCRVAMLLHSLGRAFAMLLLSSCLYTQYRHHHGGPGGQGLRCR